jgi:hypothetical protein
MINYERLQKIIKSENCFNELILANNSDTQKAFSKKLIYLDANITH